MFTNEDEKLVAEKGISKKVVSEQLQRFQKGFKPIKLERAAGVGDGIIRLSSIEMDRYQKHFEAFQGSVLKFVPSSGAATRMFKDLINFKANFLGTDEEFNALTSNNENSVFVFLNHLESFAFYGELKKAFRKKYDSSLEEAYLKREYAEILEVLLTEEGLNYENLPKGLLSFHQYGSKSRTPLEEQVVEGWAHRGGREELSIHFTVSPEHQDKFKKRIAEITERLTFGECLNFSFSVQALDTDTIAVDEENDPFRDARGKLLFRPAGHGALLENLNAVEADIVFIKNIDNILPDHFKEKSITYKKILAGILIEYQGKVFDLLSKSEQGQDIVHEGKILLAELGMTGISTRSEVVEHLNRPIRVCGMVKNEGEPGGGPLWVEKDGKLSLQIVESAQVNSSNENQSTIFKKGTHFNPVDLVCGLRNYKGEKFDLTKFRDSELGFISSKTYQGRVIKALELPGLWNGSMAHWNTIFVEVPIETFSPVKSVNDLLRREHQPPKSSAT
ncbi:MAG: DUF4301 family protein [Cyclobacteriaceae bacterium]